MWQALCEIIFGAPANGGTQRFPLRQLALIALLAEAALRDGNADTREFDSIVAIAARHFGMPPEEARALTEAAFRRAEHSVDLFANVRVVVADVPIEERSKVLEMLWEVALADGELEDHETALIRRLVPMLGMSDRDSAEARQRVLARTN
jgi:uncharacterized tellurite resistance protein B-like protein